MRSATRSSIATWTWLLLLLIAGPGVSTEHSWSHHQPALASGGSQTVTEHRPIKQGELVEGRVTENSVDAYDIALTAGQFLHVIVEQGFVDLMASVLPPDGRELGRFDVTAYGRDAISIVAEVDGVHLVNAQTQALVTTLHREIDRLVADYRELQGSIRAGSPRHAALAQPDQLNATEIQRLLDDDTLLVEYWLGEQQSFAWAVSSASIFRVALPPRGAIETVARDLYAHLTAPVSGGAATGAGLNESAGRLSRMILAPLRRVIRAKRLGFVADGALQYVPFAALTLSRDPTDREAGDPLVMGHEIISLPSASIVAMLRCQLAGRIVASRTLAVLADPVFDPQDPRVRRIDRRSAVARRPSGEQGESGPAPVERSIRDVSMPGVGRLSRLVFARQEAEAILRLVPRSKSMKAVDFAASRSVATSGALAEYRIVHLATHGVINTVHPELSGIVLSLVDERGAPQDGFLQLHDIYNLRLPADLVVLSSCQSGLGAEVRGEGLVGLTRGVMYAGAARVVVSLWTVDDEATAALMKRFYEGMLGPRRLPAAAALSAAQAGMRLEKRWKSPYFWAGFILQGEWN
jgi:CHAT domain-containing protein